MSDRLLVYEPAAPRERDSRSERTALDGITGKVVGFIDNAKPNFNHLVDDLGELLVTRYGAARVVKHRKPGQVPVAEAALADILHQCDAVITGSGD
jgi:hypothetical protein